MMERRIRDNYYEYETDTEHFYSQTIDVGELFSGDLINPYGPPLKRSSATRKRTKMETLLYVLRLIAVALVLPFLLGMCSYQAFIHHNWILFTLSVVATILNLWNVWRGV